MHREKYDPERSGSADTALNHLAWHCEAFVLDRIERFDSTKGFSTLAFSVSRTADYLFLAIVGKTTGWVAVGTALFRFNRRRSRNRGMVFYRLLELAFAHAPVRYEGLVDPTQIRRIIACLERHGRGSPPLV